MRVLAVESTKDNDVYIYGEGEYVSNKVPNTSFFKEYKVKNPCIKLDNGNN